MNAPVALTPELLTQLTAILGENRIKTDTDSLQNWGRDHTKHFDPNPSVIVFPSTTEQVQDIVKLANQFNVAVTPSGGRTGLSAGAVAANGEIVVSMDKMNQILEFFPADRMVRVQAGLVTEQLQTMLPIRACIIQSTLLLRAQARLAGTSAPMPVVLKSLNTA